MRHYQSVSLAAMLALSFGLPAGAKTPPAELTQANLMALHGLAAFSALGGTPAGKAALAANLHITAALQNGSAQQPTLLPFARQQAQALRDAAITFNNGRALADGLGSRLGGAYLALTSYPSAESCLQKPGDGKNISGAIGNLLLYTATLTTADAGAAKYAFADGKINDHGDDDAAIGKILNQYGGATNVYGNAYGNGSGPQADKFGDPRPFQTEPGFTVYAGADYFGVNHKNTDYLAGPVQCLQTSPSFPSGHTTYGYTESLLLALMVPERYSQMITRGAEYGNSRIIIGAHYAMDVLAGRALAYDDVAHLLAENPEYVGQAEGKATPITNYAAALHSARTDLRAALAAQCHGAIAACAAQDTSRFANPSANAAFYQSTQTYGLPVVYPAQAGRREDVAALAPEAGVLLTAAFPKLSLAQADQLLTNTEGPGGGFLDNGSALGVYARLNLYQAALQASR